VIDTGESGIRFQAHKLPEFIVKEAPDACALHAIGLRFEIQNLQAVQVADAIREEEYLNSEVKQTIYTDKLFSL
jgi:hypothetical protein